MPVQYPIDPFFVTQGFGEHPENYKQFGLAGHNGWDIRTKYADTPLGHRNILASSTGDFSRKGIDPKGFGNFFEVIYQLKSRWKVIYGHCMKIYAFTHVQAGEVLAVSDSTGNSTASHLHLGVKRITMDGTILNYSNGYFGAVNPQEFFDELAAVTHAPPTGGTMTDQEDAQQLQYLLKRYGKGSYNDFNQFLIDHVGLNGQGGFLQDERNANDALRTSVSDLLHIPFAFTTQQLIDGVNTLKSQPNMVLSTSGSIYEKLLTLADDFDVSGITLVPKKR